MNDTKVFDPLPDPLTDDFAKILVSAPPACILCEHLHTQMFLNETRLGLKFYHCPTCDGVFKDPQSFLDPQAEKRRYDLHQNSLEDPNYIRYLHQSTQDFLARQPSHSHGLDYGCGPVKAIEHICQNYWPEKQWQVSSYDKFYFPHLHSGSSSHLQFDFIICHEVMEHFTEPKNNTAHLFTLLKNQGQIFLRTEAPPQPLQPQTFTKWYYKNDATHVFFYSPKTIDYLCQTYQLQILKGHAPVWHLQKT